MAENFRRFENAHTSSSTLELTKLEEDLVTNRFATLETRRENSKKLKWIVLTYFATTMIFIILFIECFVMLSKVDEKSSNVANLTANQSSAIACATIQKPIQGDAADGIDRLPMLESQLAILFKQSGWYLAKNNRIYKMFLSRKNYTQAEDACKKLGAGLATYGIRDLSVKREIDTYLSYNNRKIYGFWIGLAEDQDSSEWYWADGVIANASATDWDAGQPQNIMGRRDCADLEMAAQWKIHDRPCRYPLRYLCEA